MTRWLILALAVTLSASMDAQTRLRLRQVTAAASIGTMSLSSTFDSISVQVAVLGDSDDDATATIEFRTGAGSWLSAYTPNYDNRATVFGGSANPYVDQFRGSIVGLSSGTSYDVRVTVSDPDVGTSVRTETVSTLGNPTFGGTTRFVDDVGVNGDGSSGSPFNTLSACQTAASAGDTCFIRNGTYPSFTISKSGNAGAWIKWEGESEAGVVIQGGAVTNALSITADYVQAVNFTAELAQRDTIKVSAASDHIWLDNFTVEDVSSTQTYGDAAVKLLGGASNVYILNCVLNVPSTVAYSSPRSDAPVGGVEANGGVSTVVVKGCTFDGKFRDAIAQTPENFGGGFLINSDFANNTFANIGDDNIQLEGDSINVRAWGNSITGGVSCLAGQESYVGPVYYFRNVCVLNDSGAGPTGWKGHNGASTFFFHNTFEVTVSGSDVVASGTNVGSNLSRNNILLSNGGANPIYGSSGDFDYDLLHRTGSTVLVSDSFGQVGFWENVGAGSDLFLATGQELHGKDGSPALQGAAKTILNTSLAYNAGVTLANFNDANSAWPAANGAPDIGYYEVP